MHWLSPLRAAHVTLSEIRKKYYQSSLVMTGPQPSLIVFCPNECLFLRYEYIHTYILMKSVFFLLYLWKCYIISPVPSYINYWVANHLIINKPNTNNCTKKKKFPVEAMVSQKKIKKPFFPVYSKQVAGESTAVYTPPRQFEVNWPFRKSYTLV